MLKQLTTISLLVVMGAVNAFAADPVQQEIPVPPEVQAGDAIGIWGAIAYSPTDQKRGIFWGANTRIEAEKSAIKHCNSAKGTDCKLVETFRNHRHWNDDDGTYPYNYCAVLAVDKETGKFGSSTAQSIAQAKAVALEQCGVSACKVVEQGCT